MSVQRKSPSPPASPSASAENDLEITAELPVLDVAAYEAATEARTNNTDTWIIPSPTASEPAAEARPLGVEAPPAMAAAVGSGASSASAPGEERLNSLQISLRALAHNLRDVEERLRLKGERLAEIEKALIHANAERVVAEQSARQQAAELTQARTALVAADARAAELQRALEEREAAAVSLREQDKVFAEKLALRDKALSLIQKDLTAAHALAATYMESLRSTEGRRSLFQELSTSLHWELETHTTRVSDLEGQLAALDTRARELESRVGNRDARIVSLDKQMADLNGTLSQRDATLRASNMAEDDLKRHVGSLTASVAARDERIRALESTCSQQGEQLSERQAELDRIQSEKTALSSSVASVEAKHAAAIARNTELEATASAAKDLDAANLQHRKRIDQLEAELVTVRTELQQRAVALEEAATARGEHMARIAAGDAHVEELQGRMQEQQEFVRVLQADSNASVARVKEMEGDLRAAEDMIHRLEADLRNRSTRLDELEKTHQEWRTTVEEARNALTDRDSLIRRLEEETANSAVLLGAIQQRLDSSGVHEIAPDGDKRLLIRSDADSDVVHVLGRKTTVGRTPDNDLQIDAKFISRHHAVILAGPAHTIIEDLNSTNGVLVNGRRITRQTLKDGDAVVIGKTLFRFAVRPSAAERRA